MLASLCTIHLAIQCIMIYPLDSLLQPLSVLPWAECLPDQPAKPHTYKSTRRQSWQLAHHQALVPVKLTSITSPPSTHLLTSTKRHNLPSSIRGSLSSPYPASYSCTFILDFSDPPIPDIPPVNSLLIPRTALGSDSAH